MQSDSLVEGNATLRLTGKVAAQVDPNYLSSKNPVIYDPAEGDADGGIPPGTAFQDIPETWFCPVCGARKGDFTPYEE